MSPDSPEVAAVLARLPDGDRQVIEEVIANARDAARRHAIAAILARNFSHGIGIHASSRPDFGEAGTR